MEWIQPVWMLTAKKKKKEEKSLIRKGAVSLSVIQLL